MYMVRFHRLLVINQPRSIGSSFDGLGTHGLDGFLFKPATSLKCAQQKHIYAAATAHLLFRHLLHESDQHRWHSERPSA